MPDNYNPFKVLGLTSDASDDKIASVYHKLAREYHPDLNPDDSMAEGKMKELNQAYRRIQDIRNGNVEFDDTEGEYDSDTANFNISGTPLVKIVIGIIIFSILFSAIISVINNLAGGV